MPLYGRWGTYDVFTGHVKRAPKVWQNRGWNGCIAYYLSLPVLLVSLNYWCRLLLRGSCNFYSDLIFIVIIDVFTVQVGLTPFACGLNSPND